MAKNVIINGVTYSNVPSVEMPLAGGTGNAEFFDTTDANAVAGDIRSGKSGYVNGQKVVGTIPEKGTSDVTISGENVTVPAGIYNSEVNKTVPTEEKTATPTTSAQDITPTSGKLLKKVHVNAVVVGGNATPADVINGKTFLSNGSLTPQTGTATVPVVSQDGTTKVLTIS